MTATRIVRDLSTAAVAGIAAWSSWSHMVTVALRFGERAEVAYVLPVSVDGMLVVASTAMVEDQRAGRPVRWSARIAFAAGVAASVAANITAAKPSPGARIVAAWPALALLLVVEMLARAQAARSPLWGVDAGSGDGVPTRHAPQPSNTLAEPVEFGRRDGSTPGAIGDAAARVDGYVSAAVAPPQRAVEPATVGLRGSRRSERAVDVVARLRAERPQASLAELASAAGVSQRHVRRLLAGEFGGPAAAPTMTVTGQDNLGGIP